MEKIWQVWWISINLSNILVQAQDDEMPSSHVAKICIEWYRTCDLWHSKHKKVVWFLDTQPRVPIRLCTCSKWIIMVRAFPLLTDILLFLFLSFPKISDFSGCTADGWTTCSTWESLLDEYCKCCIPVHWFTLNLLHIQLHMVQFAACGFSFEGFNV